MLMYKMAKSLQLLKISLRAPIKYLLLKTNEL